MPNNTKKTIFREGFFIIAFVVWTNGASVEAASPKQNVKEGNRLYQEGSYAASERKYTEAFEKDPESDIINFNLGTSLYKEGKYGEAIDHFQKAFLSEDNAMRGNAHYNFGNTIYQLGMEQEGKGDTAIAITSLEKSLSQYEQALSIFSDDEDAIHNYAFVQGELKRLREKQEQQQQNQDQNSDQYKNDQQQNDQNQQSQSDQNQDSQENQQQQQDQQQQSQEQKNQKSNPDQGQEQENKDDSNEQNEASPQPQNASQLTQKEAQMRLESYQRAEEPQGQFNMRKTIKDTRPVLKDW